MILHVMHVSYLACSRIKDTTGGGILSQGTMQKPERPNLSS